MFAKLFHRDPQQSSPDEPEDVPQLKDFEPRVVVHYGIPATASILTFDPIQHLLAIGTLDGRIKVIGGDNIECLLISPKPVSLKNLEFLQNQGFLVSVSNDNVIQVWDLEQRRLASNLQWESNISSFSVVCGTNYMYVGDEYGYLSVLKYGIEEGNIQPMPYNIPANLIADEAGISIPDNQSVAGLIAQPCSSGKRVLIAYQNGVIILWDVSEDKALLVRCHKDLQLKDDIIICSTSDVRRESLNNKADEEQADKEISALCWVSSDGSILAVGYVDGDILLWNLSTTKDQKAKKSSNNAVKLRLSSGDKRLPVIVLHWSSNSPHNGSGGQLFVYGGDDIGSEEVLTILNLDLSSGIDALKCVKRVDLTLNGSYADIILVPGLGAAESSYTTLFVLTNPGQLHIYDDDHLSALTSAPDRKHVENGVQCPINIPTVEPHITIAKLCSVHNWDLQKALKETVLAAKSQSASPKAAGSAKWPVSGGFPSQLSSESIGVERIYIAGYHDGSIRIWDATFPVFSLIFVIGSQVEGNEAPDVSDPISALDFNSATASLAVGNDCGLVHLLKLVGNSDETSVPPVTDTEHEETNLHHGSGWQSTTVFSLLNSPVRSLLYTVSGAKIVVGHECGNIAVRDVLSSSVLFVTDSLVSSSSRVVSLAMKTYLETNTDDHEQSENTSSDPEKEVAFVLTKDAQIIAVDNNSGEKICSRAVNPKEEATAISMYILDEKIPVPESSEKTSQDSTDERESPQSHNEQENDSAEAEVNTSSESIELWRNFVDSLILVCCADSVLLYSTKSLIQGETNFVSKIDLDKQCCWATIFKKDELEYGMILGYLTGVLEIRSLPDLKVLAETSIMSILRWNFKNNMENTMSSFGNGHITMVNGCEFAIISLFASENDFRIPEALPRLHDKVVAEAAEAALQFSYNQKIKPATPTGILSGIIKGIKGEKENENVNIEENRDVLVPKLEALFSRSPFSVSDLDLDLNLGDDLDVKIKYDEVEVNEPKPPSPASSSQSKTKSKSMETERERLLEGGSEDAEPKLRSADEIKAKYRKAGTGDTAAMALEAKNKLIERQQKLEKLKENSEELAAGSEDFASMANELRKQMENRKWWQL